MLERPEIEGRDSKCGLADQDLTGTRQGSDARADIHVVAERRDVGDRVVRATHRAHVRVTGVHAHADLQPRPIVGAVTGDLQQSSGGDDCRL